MSKSTNRYGKVIMHARANIDAVATPSDKVKREFAALNAAAVKQYGDKGYQRYDDLNDKQKAELHYTVNVARHKAKTKREEADYNREAELDQVEEAK